MFKESNAPTLSSKRGFPRMKEGLPKPLRRRGCIPPKRFFLSKRASPSCEKGVSLPRREPFLAPTKRPLYFQLIVFTPLSIRRGAGGEAFLYFQLTVFTPLSIRRGVGGEAVDGLVVSLYRLAARLFLPLNEPYKRLHLRLLYTRQHQFYLPPDRSHTPFSILLSHHPLA